MNAYPERVARLRFARRKLNRFANYAIALFCLLSSAWTGAHAINRDLKPHIAWAMTYNGAGHYGEHTGSVYAGYPGLYSQASVTDPLGATRCFDSNAKVFSSRIFEQYAYL